MISRISPKTGRVRKRSARPRMSLTDRIANLHLLLRSSSFERWPLKVTFFAQDVYRVWEKWTNNKPEKLRPNIDVVLDQTDPSEVPYAAPGVGPVFPNPTAIQALDVGYSRLKPHLEKTRMLLQDNTRLSCSICHHRMPSDGSETVICPHGNCSAITHVRCLSAAFLKSDAADNVIIPTSGHCPSCGTGLQWVDLVKELSLRLRGKKEVEVILKPKRSKKAIAASTAVEEELETSSLDDDPLDMVLDDVDDAMDDDMSEQEPCPAQDPHASRRDGSMQACEDYVVEDSDWENAEIIT